MTVSSIKKSFNTSTICKAVMKCDEKLRIFLSETDIFNKAVCTNIPKPLKNFCTQFDVNTLRYCGETASVEHLHMFGISDIATLFIIIHKLSLDIRMRIRCLMRSTWKDRNGEARSAGETTPCCTPPIRSRVSERSKSLGW